MALVFKIGILLVSLTLSSSSPLKSESISKSSRQSILRLRQLLSAHPTAELPYFCPDTATLPGCRCSSSPFYEIICEGPSVTNDVINSVYPAVRLANDFIGSSSPLAIPDFTIQNTEIRALNMSEWDQGQNELTFSILYILENRQLKSIVGPLRLESFAMYLDGNGFTDQDIMTGISSIFDSSAGRVRTLSLQNNELTGQPVDLGSGETETFPHFLNARHPALSSLRLDGNKFGVVEGGQFKDMTNLGSLRLDSNGIFELGDGAFEFTEPWPSSDGLRQIFLDFNNLTDDKVSPMAFAGVNAPTRITMEFNLFEFLSAEKFNGLFHQPPQNPSYHPKFEFDGNPFQCDERLRWLHDQKETLQRVVIGVNCTNDPGFDVFTTSLYN